MIINKQIQDFSIAVEADNSKLQVHRSHDAQTPEKGPGDLLAQFRKDFELFSLGAAEAQRASFGAGLEQQILRRWLLILQREKGPPNRLRPAKLVAEYYGICLRTLDRWLADEALEFPRPITVNRRRYFRELDLVQWEMRRHSHVAAEARA